MRLTGPIVGTLILILLISIPVRGTPALQKGSDAVYDLKAQILFNPPICEENPVSGVQSMIIVCPLTMVPLPLGTNITGTLGWSATAVSSTTALLNVTRDATISHDGLMVPDVHLTDAFNESIDLATRIINLMPILGTEIDDALQMGQAGTNASASTAMDPNMAMNNIESTMPEPHPVYTMWWMNETLHNGQIVPVLVFPTKVIGAGTFEFQGVPRSTWTLMFNKTLPSSQPATSTITPTRLGNGFSAVFTFDYDQTSGLLLSATFDIHAGFVEAVVVPSQCGSTMITPSTTCISGTNALLSSGFSIHASLTLTSTNLNLDATIGSSGSTTGGATGGSNSGSGSGGGTGGGSGAVPGGSSGSGGSGGSSGSGSSGGSNPGPSGGTGGNQPGPSTPSGSSQKPASGLAPWIYLVLAAVVIAIVAVALLIARKQSKKSSSQQTAQTRQ